MQRELDELAEALEEAKYATQIQVNYIFAIRNSTTPITSSNPSTYIQWTQHAPAEAVGYSKNEAYAYYANELCVTSRMAESEVAAVNEH